MKELIENIVEKFFRKEREHEQYEKRFKKHLGIQSREIELLLNELAKEPKNALSVREIRSYINILETRIDELEEELYFDKKIQQKYR